MRIFHSSMPMLLDDMESSCTRRFDARTKNNEELS